MALKKVATIESIGSSTRIEGSKLSDIEIEKILAGIEVQKLETRDEQEIIGYSNVMEIIFESWQEIPLTENYIKQLHAELLKYSDKDQAYRGKYKVNRNNISAFDASGNNLGTILETASPFDTPRLMESLIL